MRQLEERYHRLRRGADAWKSEHGQLRDILERLATKLEGEYELLEGLGVGGVSVVLKARDVNMDANRALKLPRPAAGHEDAFARIIASEISRLKEAEHPNVISVHRRGELDPDRHTCPYYLMDFIPDAEDALDHFRKPETSDHLLAVVEQLASGLAHLHHCNIVHLDVKLENVLVGSSGRAVVSDLGSARRLDEPSEETEVVTTKLWAHPDLLRFGGSLSVSDTNRLRIPSVPRSSLCEAFDLYALGRNLQRLLDMPAARNLGPYEHKYLDLMACRLLDGKNESEADYALGLPKSAYAELRYTSMEQVVEDLQKLTGAYALHRLVEELDEHGNQSIETTSLADTPLTPAVKKTLESPLIQRLASVRQLGFLSLVYPTASHSRLEHVLGTFSNVVRYCDALYHDPENPFFRQVMTASDLKAVCAAALCHDIGQYPLAHDLEEASLNLFSHEDIGQHILLEAKPDFPNECRHLRYVLETDWSIQPQRVSEVISASLRPEKGASIKDRVLHSILSSPIDADKVDYLVRDSWNLGVPYGQVIDFPRLLRCLTIVFRDDAGSTYAALGIHEKGKVVAEAVAFARYAMFGSVYWHHTSRAGKAMLHRATWELMERQDWTNRSVSLKKRFRKHVLGSVSREQTALPIPTSESISPLADSDRDVLRWIASLTTPLGARLVEMLMSRSLYKRVLVVSASKNTELWHRVTSVRRRGWAHVLDLQRELEKAICQRLEVDLKKTDGAEASEIATLLGVVRSGGVVLVDIPQERRGTSADLEYLPESDSRETRGLWRHPVSLEDSLLWKQLHGAFIESVGKIRVFCHPDHRGLLESVLDRPTLEGLLDTACRRVLEAGETDADEERVTRIENLT